MKCTKKKLFIWTFVYFKGKKNVDSGLNAIVQKYMEFYPNGF